MTAKEIRTVEFVVLPVSRAKARKMFQIAGACRYVWNHFREKNLADYQAFKNGKGQRPHTSYFSLGVEFTKLRHKTDWMLELPANPIKHTLKYFADALKEAMAGKKGFPKPRSRNRHVLTFTLPSKENFRIILSASYPQGRLGKDDPQGRQSLGERYTETGGAPP